jgi:Family of unknown function (DUF6011)
MQSRRLGPNADTNLSAERLLTRALTEAISFNTETHTMNDKHTVNLAQFALAGDARFTISNASTGNRFTFRVRKPQDDAPHFVSVLTGADNDNSYTYLGTIFSDGAYRHGRKSRISPDAPSAKAFDWTWQNRERLPANVKVNHEGKCGRCGRTLTVPESIESGFGPECIGKLGE